MSDPSTAARPAPLCELRGVTQAFPQPNGAPLVVLKDVSLAVYPEEVVALLGPSGCGKSTLLRILAGLIRPSSGEVLYHGAPLVGLNPGVAFVFQSFALFPWMTVLQNVEAVLEAARFSRDQIRDRATHAIRTVGLSGFEEAYPRELSGGMKQRVGMARAFSLHPELLFMDEPFSQVDALTAESLRAETLDLWSAKDHHPSSILMVSHDIKEVAYMADRIVVLGAKPGTVRTVVENPLPRPRDYRSPQLLGLVDRLHDIITGHELPDVALPELAPEAPIPVEPLPAAPVSLIMGLLEYLDARGGQEDLFKIASDTGREFGVLVAAVKAAEMLDFVDTPKRRVVLSPAGRDLVHAATPRQKELWREHLLELGLFRRVRDALERAGGQEVPREEILELIAIHLPSEHYERTFTTLVRWARFGDLFAYDEDTERLALQEAVSQRGGRSEEAG